MLSSRNPPKYRVQNLVRISKHKGDFASRRIVIFKDEEIRKTVPVNYILKNKSGQLIAGGFHEPEIEIVKFGKKYFETERR